MRYGWDKIHSEMLAAIREEGYEAAMEFAVEINPYDRGSDEAIAWSEGWSDYHRAVMINLSNELGRNP